ncbi:hypothetical protein JF50_13520 [Pseudoalteromonas luteoviolacea]|uniref:Uncharacterized protein n=1 Tax=Pseudoalteromonas luteoviolacea TaxID=43657 RepID=A0A0C1QPD3_9GAMM|nr:hypothetical protein JF50_13520 [Pseudoalteromonas luteoviolacea]
MNVIKNNFTGKTKLWEVFWVHFIFLSMVLNILTDVMSTIESSAYLFAWMPFVTVWQVWVACGLWQCAFNTKYRFFAYMSRVLSVISIIIILYYYYELAFTMSDLF